MSRIPGTYAIWRPFKYFIIINIVILAVANVYFYRSLSDFYLSQSITELSTRAKVFNLEIRDLSLTTANITMLDQLTRDVGAVTDSRITVLDIYGNVLGDTLETPEAMENHLARKEIMAALQGKTGTDMRVSSTTRQKTLYVAKPVIVNGEIIGVSRAARTVKDIEARQAGMLWRIVSFNVLILLILAVVSYVISRRYTKPLYYMERKARELAAGGFDVRVKPPKVPELKVLADGFNYMAATIEDRVQTITDQRNNLDTVLASMTDAVLVIAADETVADLNPAAALWLQLTKENAVGRDIREVVRFSGIQNFIMRALQNTAPLGADISVIHGDGREHTLRFKSSPMSGTGGCVIVFYDITRTRQAEAMRRDFVSNVSHEIRTPLAAIQVSAEALDYSGLLKGQAEEQFVVSISQHSERLGNLVNDLLLLSRIEQYPEEFATETVRLKPVLQMAVDGLSAKLAGQKERVKIDCPDALELTINARLVELALINLLYNALKYGPADTDVVLYAAEEDGCVRISVRDHGGGIAPEHLPRLFERFYRVDAARSRQTGGTGLGLAIVKHIARAHKGRAEAQSVMGGGSVFSLVLPFEAIGKDL